MREQLYAFAKETLSFPIEPFFIQSELDTFLEEQMHDENLKALTQKYFKEQYFPVVDFVRQIIIDIDNGIELTKEKWVQLKTGLVNICSDYSYQRCLYNRAKIKERFGIIIPNRIAATTKQEHFGCDACHGKDWHYSSQYLAYMEFITMAVSIRGDFEKDYSTYKDHLIVLAKKWLSEYDAEEKELRDKWELW